MDHEIVGAVIQGGATLVAAAVGFGSIFFQIARQADQTRKAVLNAEARRLKTAMYEDGVQMARSLADSASSHAVYLLGVLDQIAAASQAAANGLDIPLPRSRYMQIIDSYGEVSASALKFMFLIENRRIIDPRLIVFRDLLASRLHDTRELLISYPSILMPFLPVDKPDGGVFPYMPPDPKTLAGIKDAVDQAAEAHWDMSAWMEDFVVEIQNLMLGEVLGTTVTHRVPADPRERVIRLDDFDEIQAWLATQPFAVKQREIEQALGTGKPA